MPSPTAPPPKTERVLPPNLDDLVRKALQGRGVGALQQALLEVKGQERTVEPERVPEPELPGSEPAPIIEPLEEVKENDLSLEELLLRLESTTQEAREADIAALPALLQQMELLIQTAKTRCVTRRLPVLPPIRLPFLLLVGTASPERLAAGLQIDAMTARNLAASRTPRVALRSQSREELENRVVAGVGLQTRVIARSELLELPSALAVLGAEDAGRWKISEAPLWEDPPEPGSVPPDRRVSWESVLRVVPGEVGVYSQRNIREKSKWERQRVGSSGSGTERRMGVLDLHTPTAILRLVEGMTVWEGMPGYDSVSARLSLKGLLEYLEERGIPVMPKRVFAPGSGIIGEDGSVTGSGWPAWEEHSRVCWLMSAPDSAA